MNKNPSPKKYPKVCRPKGHVRTKENTYMTPSGHPQCRTCRNMRARSNWKAFGHQ